jgi:iron complex transport system ATP-binding protein
VTITTVETSAGRGVPTLPHSPSAVWTLRGVRFRHRGATRGTLVDVSAEVAHGRMTALLGPNGAGKSTLVQILLGTLAPASGDVWLRGRPIGSWSRAALAREIGVVPQGEAEPLFRVREIVAMGRYPHLGPWQRERAEDVAAIQRAMGRCDVSELADRWLSTLSGGERQRVRLARALAQEPSVLVLDEPTTFLDVRHEMTTFALLRALRDEGTTVVVATHNLNLAARYADELLLLREGRIVAHGTPADVLTAERVAAVYDWPVSVMPHGSGAPQVVPRDPGGR